MYQISKEKRKEIIMFINKYYNYYSPEIQNVLNEFISGGEPFFDIILGLYTYTHAIDKEINLHYDFYLNLKEKFPDLSTRRILEVASGYIPALSYIISESEQMKYEITTMDPKSLPLTINNLNILTDYFTNDTDLKKYNLIIASCPCEAIDPIISQVINKKVEMSVQTCQCGNGTGFYNRYEWLYYLDSLIDTLKVLEDDNFTIETDYRKLSYLTDAPIITVRKNK